MVMLCYLFGCAQYTGEKKASRNNMLTVSVHSTHNTHSTHTRSGSIHRPADDDADDGNNDERALKVWGLMSENEMTDGRIYTTYRTTQAALKPAYSQACEYNKTKTNWWIAGSDRERAIDCKLMLSEHESQPMK